MPAGDETSDEPAVLRVGCPMWANREWVGRHLPTDVRPGRELAAYARVCTAVEGNTTFYATPRREQVARWAEQAPAGFRLVPKAPRTVTHDRRLRGVDDELAASCRVLEPLAEADALGPVTLQLPPTFGPDDLGVLAALLPRLPGDFRWAVEPRHPGLVARGRAEATLDALLRDHDVDRVVIDTRALFAGPCTTPGEREAFARKPRLGVRPVATASTPIVRFIGQTDPAANPRWWRDWIDPVQRWLDEGREPIVFLHTPDNLDAPVLARAFHGEVGARRPLVPLPDPAPIRPQAPLF